jgi:deoxycytidine triphosphate deaminase
VGAVQNWLQFGEIKVSENRMLLSDIDLHAILKQLRFETEDQQRPFDPNVQIQPCSVDLRLDQCFWEPRKPKRGRVLDLREAGPGEIEVRRRFRARRLRNGEGITIHPGQMVLGRTFEKFSIPNGYAGKLEGRSTFARLGLAVHCTGDFINPGWRGRMPLQFVNHGKTPIVLMPYLPICQLLVIRATSPSERPYGSDSAGHKYVDDEGGPSKYWLDPSLDELQKSFQGVNIPREMSSQILAIFGKTDPEIVDRFTIYLTSLPSHEITNAREILQTFAERDTNRMRSVNRLRSFLEWSLLLLPVSVGSLMRPPYGKAHIYLWAVTLFFLPFGLWAKFFWDGASRPFTQRDIEDHFHE